MGFEASADEGLLLDLLNTTPVMDGNRRDLIGDGEAGRRWLADHGQRASVEEWETLREVRSVLQDVVRGEQSAGSLAPFLAGVAYRPAGVDDGISWSLDVPEGCGAAARAVLAWGALYESSPGRLRPCANPDCRLFLIDHSKPNTARWCSMARCGNRMKARRHYERTREATR
ncbi:CGNR zinc finger domain-containing protein [Actinomadura barringtoniae]|uniref:CGNR zinc finger domain-containing protein n=2 Tax=Actinomadura barringtoniae TaxID=1427535 RepID=A0A939PH56_9ACTN|nr:CGNR zinc finger domain-containing protein [Actinomadura barringtoniae]